MTIDTFWKLSDATFKIMGCGVIGYVSLWKFLTGHWPWE
jgi:hypothetical protein